MASTLRGRTDRQYPRFFNYRTDPSTLLARGDLILDFDFAGQITAVKPLATQYADRPMDLTDACLVRMTELNVDCRVWTVERTDFCVYRRNQTQVVPCDFPAES